MIGAGNTAMDAMRVCLRLGAEKVYCIYRRSRTECPARAEEVHHAEQEGIEFHWLTNPVEILDDGKGGVRGMRCIRMELGEPDDSGRRRPVPVAGSEHEFETDLVVFAIGTNANPIIGQTSKLKLNKRGYIETDENLATSMAGVYRRRRHRHRRRDRDRGDGRRPQGRAQHEGLSRHPRYCAPMSATERSAPASCSASICASRISRAFAWLRRTAQPDGHDEHATTATTMNEISLESSRARPPARRRSSKAGRRR